MLKVDFEPNKITSALKVLLCSIMHLKGGRILHSVSVISARYEGQSRYAIPRLKHIQLFLTIHYGVKESM
jgi:hypothetical protein